MDSWLRRFSRRKVVVGLQLKWKSGHLGHLFTCLKDFERFASNLWKYKKDERALDEYLWCGVAAATDGCPCLMWRLFLRTSGSMNSMSSKGRRGCGWGKCLQLDFCWGTGIPSYRHWDSSLPAFREWNYSKRWRSRLQGRDITSCPTGIRDGPCIQNYWILLVCEITWSTESAVIFLRQPFDGPFLSLSPPPDKMWYLLLFMYLVRALHSLRLFISAGWSGRTDGLHRSTQFIKAKYDETKTLSVNTCEPQTTCSQMEVSPLKNGLIGIGIGLCLCAIFWRLSGGVPACLQGWQALLTWIWKRGLQYQLQVRYSSRL